MGDVVAAIVPKTSSGIPEEGKCGVGPRLPFLVISPFVRSNRVDNALIDQSSVVQFIEYNGGCRRSATELLTRMPDR